MSQPNITVPVGSMNPGVAAAIVNGGTVSAAIPLNGMSLVGILLPAAFTGTALTFQGSQDGTNFFPVHTSVSGTALSYTVAQGNYYAINPADFQGLAAIKIVSGTTETGARALTCSLKGI